MPYANLIVKGLHFLSSVQNRDGGIPATKPGDPSGCWTTAETLEMLLTAGVHRNDPRPFASNLINFLLGTMISSGTDLGGWPLVAGGQVASSMATGHVVAALAAAGRFYISDVQLCQQLQSAITRGLDWLETHGNSEQGWGVEPSSGGDGAELRMISTVYALRAYISNEKNVHNSGTVRHACQAILSLQNSDGGFSGKKGLQSDPCNTARALTSLLMAGSITPRDRAASKARRYILKNKPPNKVWVLSTESYVVQSAPGQTVFNSNTPVDVIEALLRLEQYDRLVETGISWLAGAQNDNGSWFLSSQDQVVSEVITWPTNEAISALALASRQFALVRIPQLTAEWHRYRRTMVLLTLFCVTEGLILLFSPQSVQKLWAATPEWVRSLVVSGLVLALLVNLLSSYLFEKVRNR